MTTSASHGNSRMVREIGTISEITPTEGDDRSEINTKNHPTGICALPPNKNPNNPYQRDFLIYMECFINMTNTDTIPSILSLKKKLRGQDILSPQTDTPQNRDMKHEPDHKDIPSIV